MKTKSILVIAVLFVISPSTFASAIVVWGYDYFGQVSSAPSGNDFVAIAAGGCHDLALKADGSIVAWGNNNYDQLLVPAGNDFVKIAAGDYHNLALKSDGSIVGWGYNRYGDATPPAGNNFVAIAAGSTYSVALKSDGSIVGWGNNNLGSTSFPPPAGNDFVAIAAGGFHSLALKSNGSIVGWGWNAYGQATPPVGNNFTAIAAGEGHSLALKSDGSIVAWGISTRGQLSVPAGNDFVKIAAGGFLSLALKSNGSIVGWGYDSHYNSQMVPAGNNFISIEIGGETGLALTGTPPIANAGSDQTVMDADDNGSEEVTLNGSGSSDSDGTIVSWVWTDDLGDTIPDGEITTSALSVGIHNIILTVTDNDGLTDTDTVTVTVEPYPNQPPSAVAGSDQTVIDIDDNGSEIVTLDGSGSNDPDGSIVNYEWSEEGNQIATGVNPTVTLPVGTHIITLIVTDNDGLTDTDTVTVTVEEYPNQPPVANADGPYTIYVDDTLTLNASDSTDYDNDIVSYLWDLDDNNSFETDAGDQPVFDVNFDYLQSIGLVVDNTYNIHLKVTDSVGQSDVNATTLTILPIPTLQVYVDIKPGSCPNPVNVKSSGVLPAAILGTADFDITTIDATSIRLAGVEPLRSSFEDVAGPVADSNDCNCTEDGPDGFPDLTLKFKTQKIVEAIGDVNEGDVLTLDLTGVLIGERPIEGADCILIRGGHKPFNKADINKDGKVDCFDFAIFAQNWLQSSIVED